MQNKEKPPTITPQSDNTIPTKVTPSTRNTIPAITIPKIKIAPKTYAIFFKVPAMLLARSSLSNFLLSILSSPINNTCPRAIIKYIICP